MFIGTQEQLYNSLEELGNRSGVAGKCICDAARAELASLMAEISRVNEINEILSSCMSKGMVIKHAEVIKCTE